MVISYTDIQCSVDIPMGTSCDLFGDSRFVLFCYKRDFISSLSDDNQADIIEAFN